MALAGVAEFPLRAVHVVSRSSSSRTGTAPQGRAVQPGSASLAAGGRANRDRLRRDDSPWLLAAATRGAAAGGLAMCDPAGWSREHEGRELWLREPLPAPRPGHLCLRPPRAGKSLLRRRAVGAF